MLGRGDLHVTSAGLHAVVGGRVPKAGIEVAKSLDVELGLHRGRQLTESMAYGARLVVAMEFFHVEDLEERFEVDGVRLLSGWAPGPIRPAGIPDPHRCPKWAFETSYALIGACVDRLITERWG